MIFNFVAVLLISFILIMWGFILLIRGTRWIKPWGKQYQITNARHVKIGLIIMLIGFILILWQVIIRQ